MLKTSLLLLTLIKMLQCMQTCSLLLSFNFTELDCVKMKSKNKKTTAMVITYKIQMKEILLGPDLRVYEKKYKYHSLTKKNFSINIENQPNAECFSSAVIKIREKNDISEKATLIFQDIYNVDYLNKYIFTKNEVKEKERKILFRNIECEGHFPFFGHSEPEYFYSIKTDLKGEEFGEQESLVINLQSNYVLRFEKNKEEKLLMENLKIPFLDESTISFVVEKNGDSLKRKLPRKKKKKNNKNKKVKFFDQVEVHVFKKKSNSEEELSEDENFNVEQFAIGGTGIIEKIGEGDILGIYQLKLKEENPLAFVNKKKFIADRQILKDKLDKLENMHIGKKEPIRVYI